MSKLTLEELAALPFLRRTTDERSSLGEMISGGIFDCGHAVAVWDARNRLALNKMIEAEPDLPHESPDGLLHYVPHKGAHMSQDKPVLSKEQKIARQVWDEMELGFSFSQPQADDIARYTDEVVKRALDRQGWISVEESLPENGVRVLIWWKIYGNEEPYARIGYHVNGHWRPEGGNGNFDDMVDHWMPLPPAPQQQGTDNEPPQVVVNSASRARKPLDQGSQSGGDELPVDLARKALEAQDVTARPASGSPDLVGRLEYWGDYFETSWAKACKEAAQALRALEAERDACKKLEFYWLDQAKISGDLAHERSLKVIALQHEADRLRGWLGEALDGWQEWVGKPPQLGSNAVAAERAAQIRKDAKISSE